MARQLFHYKGQQGEVIVEMVIWVLPSPRTNGHKYRRHCGRSGECVVRYDNEVGKGDHRHYGTTEMAYVFESMPKLLADFRDDCARLAGWRWDE